MRLSVIALSASTWLVSAPVAAQAAEAALQRCRAVNDSVARLACYDAIAAPTTATTPAAPSRQPQPAAAAVPAAAPERFGFLDRNPADAAQTVESRVADDFYGWGPGERIRLANGQVWEVTDGSSGAIRPANRKVTVRRGALGSFFIEFEGLNNSPRVRRIQ